MKLNIRRSNAGFAVLEAVLIVVVFVAIIGTGAWVVSRHNTGKGSLKTASTANIDEDVVEAEKEETAVSTIGSTAKSPDTSATSIGDSFDENTF